KYSGYPEVSVLSNTGSDTKTKVDRGIIPSKRNKKTAVIRKMILCFFIPDYLLKANSFSLSRVEPGPSCILLPITASKSLCESQVTMVNIGSMTKFNHLFYI